MLAGDLDGRKIGLEELFAAVGKVAAGKMKKSDLYALECAACPGAGSCAGLYTANSMNCLTEALGIALPGNGTTLDVALKAPPCFVVGQHDFDI